MVKLTITITCEEDVVGDRQDVDYRIEHESGLPVPLTQVLGLLEQVKIMVVRDALEEGWE